MLPPYRVKTECRYRVTKSAQTIGPARRRSSKRLQRKPKCNAEKDRVGADRCVRIAEVGFFIEAVIAEQIKKHPGQQLDVQAGAEAEERFVNKSAGLMHPTRACGGINSLTDQKMGLGCKRVLAKPVGKEVKGKKPQSRN